MTLSDAVTLIYDQFSDYEGIGPVRIRHIYQEAYNKIAREFRLPTMRYTETSAWVSGTSHDPSSDLTRWRGAPESIISTSESVEWKRRDPWDITRRQNEQGSSSGLFDRFEGRLCYAVSGPDKKIHVVSALTSSETLTITHYAGPNTFTADTDTIDIPDDYLYMPIILAQIEIWKILNNNDTDAVYRKSLPDVLQLEWSRYKEMEAQLKKDMTRGEGIDRQVRQSPLMRSFSGMVTKRRGQNGYYLPGDIF